MFFYTNFNNISLNVTQSHQAYNVVVRGSKREQLLQKAFPKAQSTLAKAELTTSDEIATALLNLAFTKTYNALFEHVMTDKNNANILLILSTSASQFKTNLPKILTTRNPTPVAAAPVAAAGVNMYAGVVLPGMGKAKGAAGKGGVGAAGAAGAAGKGGAGAAGGALGGAGQAGKGAAGAAGPVKGAAGAAGARGPVKGGAAPKGGAGGGAAYGPVGAGGGAGGVRRGAGPYGQG